MSRESGGELGASMLGVGMLDAVPAIFALEVSSGCVPTMGSDALLAFIAASELGSVAAVDVDALLAFVASQVGSSGIGGIELDARLAFPVSQIEVSGLPAISLDAWLQMLHAQGEIAAEVAIIANEERSIRIYGEQRVVKPSAEVFDVITSDDRAVTI